MDSHHSDHDLFEQLCGTVAKPGIDPNVVRAAVLQLAAGRTHGQDIGAPVREDINLAVVADANVNFSRFLTGLEDILPESGVAHLNGTSATHSGAIGSVKDGSLSRGPFLDKDIIVSYVEQSGALDSRVTDALQQILDSSRYSFTKRNYQSTVNTTGGVFLAATPSGGSFDEYEKPSRQLTVPLKLVKATDLVLLNKSDAGGFDRSEGKFSKESAAKHILESWKTYPELSSGAIDLIQDYVSDYREAIDNIDVSEYGSTVTFGPARLEESMRRFTEAHAKIRLEDEATAENAEVIVDLFEDSHSDLGVTITRNDGTFDADIVETSDDSSHDLLSDDAKERREALKQIVGDLEMQYDDGAPIDEIISRTGNIGLGPSKTEHLLDKLKQRGEAYEPSTDTLRTT